MHKCDNFVLYWSGRETVGSAPIKRIISRCREWARRVYHGAVFEVKKEIPIQMRASPSMITLRQATLEDLPLLFKWRNDLLTRENSHNQDPVAWEDHCNWLASSLKNADRKLFVGVAHHPIGTSRLDRTPECVELSYTVAPDARGKGYGQALVRETLIHCKGPVKATVKAQNHPSKKILQKAGFELISEENGVLVYMLRL